MQNAMKIGLMKTIFSGKETAPYSVIERTDTLPTFNVFIARKRDEYM
ncbi:hypothetical protein KDH_02040 [Dictyobacter sp. S3.2.2.5]|uniref:Uncharacterized protein n=1 Tax=Dictyobacter halimunensis TaxID=3026934 RepID=A0ABQ6FIE8_9CHLR|nr:hypothetical protein KDH_02040 [Dictyobacter sp. S3.2.2.5]